MDATFSTHIVKIGEHGLLTIALPNLAGRYIVIEQRGSQVVVSPIDLESDSPSPAIARREGHFTLLGSPTRNLPEA